jgi:hypothetical protein
MASGVLWSQSRDEDEFVGIEEGPGELLLALRLEEGEGVPEFVGFRRSVEA